MTQNDNLYAIKFPNGRYALYSDMEPEWFDNDHSQAMSDLGESPIFRTTSLDNIDHKCCMIKDTYVRAGLDQPELWISCVDRMGTVNMRRHGDDESLSLKPCPTVG